VVPINGIMVAMLCHQFLINFERSKHAEYALNEDSEETDFQGLTVRLCYLF
jgi:hypothetical protein